jgi:hypothetical protein
MSAKQLHLHYAIYRSAQRLFVKSGKRLNVMQGTELAAAPIWLASAELAGLGLQQDIDLPVLHRLGLVSEYKTDMHILTGGQYAFPYCMAKITTFGVLLYCAALNKLQKAREFSLSILDTNTEIAVPETFGSTIDELIQSNTHPASSNPADPA